MPRSAQNQELLAQHSAIIKKLCNIDESAFDRVTVQKHGLHLFVDYFYRKHNEFLVFDNMADLLKEMEPFVRESLREDFREDWDLAGATLASFNDPVLDVKEREVNKKIEEFLFRLSGVRLRSMRDISRLVNAQGRMEEHLHKCAKRGVHADLQLCDEIQKQKQELIESDAATLFDDELPEEQRRAKYHRILETVDVLRNTTKAREAFLNCAGLNVHSHQLIEVEVNRKKYPCVRMQYWAYADNFRPSITLSGV